MLLLTRLQLTNINSRYSIYIQWRIFRTVHYSKDRSLFEIQRVSVPSPQRAALYLPYGGDIERTASSFTLEGATLSTIRWRHRTDCEFLHPRGSHSIYRTVATSNGLRVSQQRAPLYLPYGGDIERTASSFTAEGATLSTVRWRHRTDCEFLHPRGSHSIYRTVATSNGL